MDQRLTTAQKLAVCLCEKVEDEDMTRDEVRRIFACLDDEDRPAIPECVLDTIVTGEDLWPYIPTLLGADPENKFCIVREVTDCNASGWEDAVCAGMDHRDVTGAVCKACPHCWYWHEDNDLASAVTHLSTAPHELYRIATT